jgi:hypothetical protein
MKYWIAWCGQYLIYASSKHRIPAKEKFYCGLHRQR